MIKIRGDFKTKRNLKVIANFPANVKREIRKSLYQSGKDIAGTKGSTSDGAIKQEINKKPKKGRVYAIRVGLGGRRLARTRLHTASAVGQSPAVITGHLRKSVNFTVKGSRRLEISAGGSRAPYAKALELGTKRIAARRFMIRPIIRSRRNIINNFKWAIKNAT